MHASMPCRAVVALATASVVTLLSAAPGSAQPVNPSPQLYVGDNRPQPVIFREGRLNAPGNDTITFPNAAYAIAGAPQGLFFSTNSGLGIFNTHML